MALGLTHPLTVPGAFPGGKDGRCVRLTNLPQSCAVVMKSGNLNFLEPSGPLQACNGTALPYLRFSCLTPVTHFLANHFCSLMILPINLSLLLLYFLNYTGIF